MFLFCFTSFLHDLQINQHHTGFFQISFVFPYVLCYTVYVRNLSAAIEIFCGVLNKIKERIVWKNTLSTAEHD